MSKHRCPQGEIHRWLPAEAPVMRGQRMLFPEADVRRCVVCFRFLRGAVSKARRVCCRCRREWERINGAPGGWERLIDLGAMEVGLDLAGGAGCRGGG